MKTLSVSCHVLHEPLQQSATNFAYYKCGDKDALDLVQDAFAKVWRIVPKLI
jgi:DNA-directed RNA polymerase specialized sigma24 family protein